MPSVVNPTFTAICVWMLATPLWCVLGYRFFVHCAARPRGPAAAAEDWVTHYWRWLECRARTWTCDFLVLQPTPIMIFRVHNVVQLQGHTWQRCKQPIEKPWRRNWVNLKRCYASTNQIIRKYDQGTDLQRAAGLRAAVGPAREPEAQPGL